MNDTKSAEQRPAIIGSNSLPDLAARIVREHEAIERAPYVVPKAITLGKTRSSRRRTTMVSMASGQTGSRKTAREWLNGLPNAT
jgi:hypothetical protein